MLARRAVMRGQGDRGDRVAMLRQRSVVGAAVRGAGRGVIVIRVIRVIGGTRTTTGT